MVPKLLLTWFTPQLLGKEFFLVPESSKMSPQTQVLSLTNSGLLADEVKEEFMKSRRSGTTFRVWRNSLMESLSIREALLPLSKVQLEAYESGTPTDWGSLNLNEL